MKTKNVSSVELTEECLKNALRSKNNTYISLLNDSAVLRAKKADEEIHQNGTMTLLHGIPFSLKDLFITKGIRTTAGSKMLFNYIPPYESFVAQSLLDAGGILIGKTNLDEFGMGATNETSAFGPVLNPLDPKKSPGGSSGGSAVSIIEESSYFSMGTDTGGSIRLPANYCGLVGYRPSYGRVSRYGQIAFSSSLDQAAPIAQCVLDIACIMELISTKDRRDETNLELGKLDLVSNLLSLDLKYIQGKKIGLSEHLLDECEEDVKIEMLKALAHFKKMGAELVPISLPHLKESLPAYYAISSGEASSNLARYTGSLFGLQKSNHELTSAHLKDHYFEQCKTNRTSGFGDEVKFRLLIGALSLLPEKGESLFKKASQVRRLVCQDFELAFSHCDFIFSPVSRTVASDLNSSISFETDSKNDFYNVPASLAGLPALALPFGKGKNNLPTGFQLISKALSDSELLKIGHAFELSLGRDVV